VFNLMKMMSKVLGYQKLDRVHVMGVGSCLQVKSPLETSKLNLTSFSICCGIISC
jgi:hypothetical protein